MVVSNENMARKNESGGRTLPIRVLGHEGGAKAMVRQRERAGGGEGEKAHPKRNETVWLGQAGGQVG